jgi:hypothetical protein
MDILPCLDRLKLGAGNYILTRDVMIADHSGHAV